MGAETLLQARATCSSSDEKDDSRQLEAVQCQRHGAHDIGKPSGPQTGFENKNNLECHCSDVFLAWILA